MQNKMSYNTTMDINKFVLPNGVRIVTERVSGVRSAAAGIWVASGSRNELPSQCGASHFIEHLLFKGTETRSAAELANLMDSIGGQINAFTSKELTCFHGRVLDEHLPLLLDVLSDMFFNSRFDEKDVINELGVILEEIDMYEDTPDDLAAERLFSGVYRGTSLARPILGTRATLSKMTGTFLRKYRDQHYLGGNIVVALSGSFSEENVNFLIEKFSSVKSGDLPVPEVAVFNPMIAERRKPVEQNHLVIGFPGCSVTDERRFAFQMLSNLLGGGMSSRLFQRLREQLGLCYSVYSYLSAQNDGGLLAFGLALTRANEPKAIRAFIDEINRFLNDGIPADELSRAREQVKSSILLGMESTGSRMTRLGRGEIAFGEVQTPDETIKGYNAVTEQDILSIAADVLSLDNFALSAVGNVRSKNEYRNLMQ